MRRSVEAPRCGVCDRRCRDDGEAFACEQAHKNDPCWKCGAVHGHALGCVFAEKPIIERKAA